MAIQESQILNDSSPKGKPQLYQELPSYATRATILGIMVAMLLAALDQTIVGTAMPKVIADLHGFEHYAGVFTAYLVASTTIVPIVGKLSDFYGRKPFLLWGVALFVISSLLCGLAQSLRQLIIFRGFQGLGAGITQVMSFATMADLFPPNRRGRVTGLMGSVFALASVLGPAIGGFLADGPGWRYIFLINLPIGLIAFGILFKFFPHIQSHREQKLTMDYFGVLTLTFAVVPLLLALSWGGRAYPWFSPTILLLSTLGLIMLITFLIIERRVREPILPIHLLKKKIVWSAMVGATLIAIAMFGTTLFIPLFIQTVMGATATRSGAVLMPMTLSIVFSGMIVGPWVSHCAKYRTMAILGVFLAALGMYLLSLMDAQTRYVSVIRNMVILGTGLGITMPVFTLSVQNSVDAMSIGSITSTIQFLRSVGGSLGVALFGSVLTNRFSPLLVGSLPPEILSKISLNQLGKLNNPQTLIQSGLDSKLGSLFSVFGVKAQDMLNLLQHTARVSLATAIHEMFLLGTIFLGVALLVVLFSEDPPPPSS